MLASVLATDVRRVVFLGTYSLHPRQKLLLEVLEGRPDWEFITCHVDLWGDLPDKTRIGGWGRRTRMLLKMSAAYPLLTLRYLCLPRHDAVVMMHAGLLDVLLLGWLVKLRRKPLLWDVYISWYDTLVNDRNLLKAGHPGASILRMLEKAAVRTADISFLDTRPHADFFEKLHNLPAQSVGVVHVGVDSAFLSALRRYGPGEEADRHSGIRLLYYGNFIPLHGVDTMVEAVGILNRSGVDVELLLVGRGQTESAVAERISALGLSNVRRIPWLAYPELAAEILKADVCLGIFGTSGKAQRVIPNKIYQVAAAGVPFVTALTPAIKEFCRRAGGTLQCELVPAGDADALAKGIRLLYERTWTGFRVPYVFDVDAVRDEWIPLLLEVMEPGAVRKTMKESSHP